MEYVDQSGPYKALDCGFICGAYAPALSIHSIRHLIDSFPFAACDCILPNTRYGNNSICDMKSGQCVCKPKISGRPCDRCHENAYNASDVCVGKYRWYWWTAQQFVYAHT